MGVTFNSYSHALHTIYFERDSQCASPRKSIFSVTHYMVKSSGTLQQKATPIFVHPSTHVQIYHSFLFANWCHVIPW